MGRKRTNAEFISIANEKHKKRYDYSKTSYKGARSKVIIQCIEHGQFEQTPDKHLSGQGCPECLKTYKLTTATFIEKAIVVHGAELYDYSLVKYSNTTTKVVVKCPIHGNFEQAPYSHLQGSGCPACGKVKRIDQTEFLQQSIQVHGTKYDYSMVKYRKTETNVVIVCPSHGCFDQTPKHHLMGRGCRKCATDINAAKQRHTTQQFIEKAQILHDHKYDYSQVVYTGCGVKVNIICSHHGLFEQTPSSHLSSNGCIQCAGVNQSNTMDFIRKANLVHSGKYDYSKVEYIDAKTKVIIECIQHKEFRQTPNGHLRGAGCPKCACKGFSKAQILWLDFLEKYHGITIRHIGNSAQEYRIKNTRLKADGYCTKTNTVYEFHGDYWHGNPARYDSEYVHDVLGKKMKTLYANTMKREQKIKDLGYNLVVIWESDWTKINRSIRLLQRSFKSKK